MTYNPAYTNSGMTLPAGSATMAESAPVVIAVDQTPIPVTMAISPTSGLTDSQLRATPVPVSFNSSTTDVTDRSNRILGHITVDGAPTTAITNANLDTALSTRLKPADTLSAVGTIVNPVSLTLPTLTKGTQGSTGFSVQILNNAGRNTRIFMLDAITIAPASELLVGVVQWYNNSAVSSTTTPAVVPAGKILRLTGWKMQYQSLSSVGYAVVKIRFNTGGLAVLGSALVASFEAGSGAGATTVAMTGGVTTQTGAFPEGLELPAGGGIGFTIAGYGPTGASLNAGGVRFEVHGYEY